MFVILTVVSIAIGVIYNWSLLIDIMTNENNSNHWSVIIFDLIDFVTEMAKIALFFVIIFNLAYYGIKSIFRLLKLE
jgi:Na+/H+-dicarboxylate symporter